MHELGAKHNRSAMRRVSRASVGLFTTWDEECPCAVGYRVVLHAANDSSDGSLGRLTAARIAQSLAQKAASFPRRCQAAVAVCTPVVLETVPCECTGLLSSQPHNSVELGYVSVSSPQDRRLDGQAGKKVGNLSPWPMASRGHTKTSRQAICGIASLATRPYIRSVRA
jgi:hypothetical protein